MMFRVKLVWFVFGTLFLSASSELRAQQSDLDRLLQGEWNVTSRVIAGKSDTAFVNATLTLTESDRAEIKLAGGQTMKIKFVRRVHDESTKTFRFSIETSEDNQAMGGGGPRKGICKINDKGELEIIETRSASKDFPKEFSDASKAAAMFWKLTKKPISK